MRNNLRRFLLIILSVILFSATMLCFGCDGCNGCKETPPDENNFVLELSKTKIESIVGDFNTLRVKNDIEATQLEWKSENEEVAKITTDGLTATIESYNVGETKITATYNNVSASCEIVVGLGQTLPQLVIRNERPSYKISKSTDKYPLETYISFNNREFSDMTIECSSSNDQVIKFEDASKSEMSIVGLGKANIIIKGSWRGYSSDNQDPEKKIPSLYKEVEIEIVDDIFFFVNDEQIIDIELYTVSEHGKDDQGNAITYATEMNFVPSVMFNGTMHQASEIGIAYPQANINFENSKISSKRYGSGIIELTYPKTVSEGQTQYTCAINVDVIRPKTTIASTEQDKISYFSTFTGTYKDAKNNYADTSLIETLFPDDQTNELKIYQYKKGKIFDKETATELKVDNSGKILGIKNDNNGMYQASLYIETDKVIYNVETIDIYSLVIQNKNDLKLLEQKIIIQDDPNTIGIDEARATSIDGYCELINNIDAEGTKIEHQILNETYNYYGVDAQNPTQRRFIPSKYYYVFDAGLKDYKINPDGYDHGKYGFSGYFNGNGYTISNLDTSVESGKKGGFFGYLAGAARIENLGLKDIKMTNSNGLISEAILQRNAPSGIVVDPYGLAQNKFSINNIYISISSDTQNPKGAIMNSGNSFGLYNMENIVVDASNVANLDNGDSVFFGTDIQYRLDQIAAPTANDEFYAQGRGRYKKDQIYVISNGDLPLSKHEISTSIAEVYGENKREDDALRNHLIDDKIYPSGIYQYSSYEQLGQAGHNYGENFSDAWVITMGYPIYKTAQDVWATLNGDMLFGMKIRLNSTTQTKKLGLYSMLQDEEIDIESIDFNASKISIDNEWNIKLAREVSDKETEQITINYKDKNNAPSSIVISIELFPSEIEIDVAVEMSAYDGIIDLSKAEFGIENPSAIVSAIQTFNGEETNNLTIVDQKLRGLEVKIKADNSDVEISTITIETSDLTYKFTNVKVYSHLIKKANDLKVFEQTKISTILTGYYKLLNNIDARLLTLTHEDGEQGIGYLLQNVDHSFQGIFDGQGYVIYNFKPTIGGLFGGVCSTEDNDAIIRNVAFINVSPIDGTPFSILGKFIDTYDNNSTAATPNAAKVENVHVSISKTTQVASNLTTNYKGLFANASMQNKFGFSFKNVFIEIKDEFYHDTLETAACGTLFSRDYNPKSSSQAEKSSRFNNVITIAKTNPCAYRQYVGGGWATEFGEYMYVMYSETDIGGQGLRFAFIEGNQYAHNPISATANGENGSYVLNNVYRYDSRTVIPTAKLQLLDDSGCWKLENAQLVWEKANKYLDASDEEYNFDTDGIEQIPQA